jgi:iron complex outermembrane receptor protein
MKNYTCAHFTAPISAAIKLSFGLTVFAISSQITLASLNLQSIETIKVKGQINSLLKESEIDLSASSAPDLRSQLSQLPGVNINGNGRVSGIVQYRGLYSDRVQVTIDDMLIAGAGPNAMDSPLSHVIASLSQNITLYHAIAPVTAGAETLGGAIDISDIAPILSNSQDFEYSGAVTAAKFLNEGQILAGKLQALNQNTYVTLIADKQEGDNFESGSGLVVANTYYERSGLKVNAGYQGNGHNISLLVSQRTTDKSGTPALAMDIDFIDALVMAVNYEYEFDQQWSFKAKLAGNNNEHEMNNFSQRANPMPAMHRINTVDSEGRIASISVTQINPNWQNEYGIDVRTTEHNSRITNPNVGAFFLQNFNNVNRNIHSLYAQWQRNYPNEIGFLNWQIGTRLSRVLADADRIDTNMAMMNANVRVLRDEFNASDRSLDFSLIDVVLKTSYGLSKNIKLQASAAIKQKAPSYNQLYSWFPLGVSAGLADGRNYLGNTQLNKEQAAKVDVGMLIRGDDWTFMPNIFYTDISDYIIGVTSTNMAANMIANMNNIQVPLIWQNQDAVLTGFDFTYSQTLTSDLALNVSGQYVRAKQLEDIEQDLYRIAPLSLNMSLQWNQSDYQVNFMSRWVAAQNKVATLQNETPSAGYAVFDLQVKYQFTPDLELTLLAENLLDKNYVDHLSGVNRVSATDIANGAKLPSAGRNLGLGLSYQF